MTVCRWRLGQSGAFLGRPVQVLQDRAEGPDRDQRAGGVQDVLAGRPVMHPAGRLRPRLLGDHLGQLGDQWHDRIPSRHRPAAQIIGVEPVGLADRARWRPPPPRARARPGPRPRPGPARHPASPAATPDRTARERRWRRRRAVRAGRRCRQMARKGVSWAPCNRMSNRSPSPSAAATSLARTCGSLIEASSGSAAFASASSGK